jgi:hypothetical protein
MLDIITDYPIWLILFWLPLAVGLAYWFYQPTKSWLKEVAKWKRWLMLSLRALSLFIIGLLLLGILFETLNIRKEKPLLINLIDNSASMLNYADSNRVRTETSIYLENVEKNFSRFDIVNIFLNDSIEKGQLKPSFKANKSNLYEFLDNVYQNYYGRNIGAVQLISDGNFNAGGNPLTLSDRFTNIPIYTIGVGDTIRKKDLLIRNTLQNEIAFLGNSFPVEVTVEGDLVNDLKTNVKILKNNKEVKRKDVSFGDADFSQQKIEFQLNADAVGFQEYKVVIESVDGESNYENNERTFYIEVIDSRSKVLLIAGGLHPDLGAIKNVLETDENLEIETVLTNEFSGDISVYDLLIWHEPGIGNSDAIIEALKKSNKPVWYILGTRSSNEKINKLPLPIMAKFGNQQDNVSAQMKKTFGKFELSDDSQRSLSKFPPLSSPYGDLKINGSIDILFNQQLGNISKEDPLFFFGNYNQAKYALLQAEGIWRWKLADYQINSNNDAFNEIIKKTVQYLSVRSNTSRLRVQLPNTFYDDQSISLSATFYNESYEPIVEPTIQFKLTNNEGEEQVYAFLPSRSEYNLFLGELKAGSYEWEAFTEYEGKLYKKTGAFVIQRVELESLDTRANHNLLFQLANSSDRGKFFKFSNRSQFIKELDKRNDISSVGYESFSFQQLIDYKWIFILLILSLSLEWFMRRYNGAY